MGGPAAGHGWAGSGHVLARALSCHGYHQQAPLPGADPPWSRLRQKRRKEELRRQKEAAEAAAKAAAEAAAAPGKKGEKGADGKKK